MVVDSSARLSLDDIMTMSMEIDQMVTRREVHNCITQAHTGCNFKKSSGHNDGGRLPTIPAFPSEADLPPFRK